MSGDISKTVGTTSTSILAHTTGPRVKGTWLVNPSPYSIIYVMVNAPAVVGQGVRLNPNGGRWFTPTQQDINAITTTITMPNGSSSVATLTGNWD